MAELEVFKIDGAAVMPDIQFVGKKSIKLPDINDEYKFLAYFDRIPFASKDGKSWVMAIAVEVNGEHINPSLMQLED